VITKVKTAFLYVGDQDRSYAFYVDKLGFEVHTDTEMRAGSRWLEVTPPGGQTTIALAAAKDFDKRPGEDSSDLTFSTADLQATYEELKSKGVDISEPVSESWATFCRFTDPDGHEFLVSEGD
jgi:lactoylglutathione lyase